MNRAIFTLLICLLASSAVAQERRIQDLSLSPEETAQQQNIVKKAPDTFQNDVSKRSETLNHLTNPTRPADPSVIRGKSFMEGYCDPNFVSMLANNRKYFGQEECLKQVRDDACARFKSLPDDVKGVMDDAIGCLFTNSNSYAAEKNQEVNGDSVTCAASYVNRIDLLKKYTGDYYTTYALLFMADDVLDTPGRCVNRR